MIKLFLIPLIIVTTLASSIMIFSLITHSNDSSEAQKQALKKECKNQKVMSEIDCLNQ